MMDEEQLFESGRYRNVSFGFVFKNDRRFCKAVLNDAGSTRFQEFRQFLLSRSIAAPVPCRTQSEIREEGLLYFLGALPTELLAELKSIIGRPRVTVKKLHSPCDSGENLVNSFVVIFYHFFVEKLSFSLQGADAHSTYVEGCASVFPFKVDGSVKPRDLMVLDIYDSVFINRIQEFLNLHFDDVRFDDIVPLFLWNIDEFEEECFPDHHHYFRTLLDDLLEKGNLDREDVEVLQRENKYLKNCLRLNSDGALRFKKLYRVYEEVVELYKGELPACDSSNSYLLNLPEINCGELFALLDPTIFSRHCEKYTKLFEKYLFFFVRALASGDNPVFFIDNVLFECLKSLQMYSKSREDVFQMFPELAMMSLVYLRKTGQVGRKFGNEVYKVDIENLIQVRKYIEDLPNIESTSVNLDVKADCLRFPIFLCSSNSCVDLRFTNLPRHSTGVRNLEECILMASFCPRNIQYFDIYNPFLGIETTIEIPPSEICERVRQFVRTYNRWDFSQEFPKNAFLTKGLSSFFTQDPDCMGQNLG